MELLNSKFKIFEVHQTQSILCQCTVNNPPPDTFLTLRKFNLYMKQDTTCNVRSPEAQMPTGEKGKHL